MLNTHEPITEILQAYGRGETEAMGRLVPLIYDHLRRLAHRELRRLPVHSPAHALDTTGLVHEAYLKLADRKAWPWRDRPWRDRGHFFSASAQAMRHVLVDAARRRLSAKRGSGASDEALDDPSSAPLAVQLVDDAEHAAEVLAVDRALADLRSLDERLCQVVECRFFAGMTEEETATAVGVSARTVHRDWLRARAWLRVELGRASVAGS